MKLSTEAIEALTGDGIPSHMHGGIIRYYENGIEPGHFLSAVINNDLQQAVAHADEKNVDCLKNYVQWFYWHVPSGSWGYPGAVMDWITGFREVG